MLAAIQRCSNIPDPFFAGRHVGNTGVLGGKGEISFLGGGERSNLLRRWKNRMFFLKTDHEAAGVAVDTSIEKNWNLECRDIPLSLPVLIFGLQPCIITVQQIHGSKRIVPRHSIFDRQDG